VSNVEAISDLLEERFGERLPIPPGLSGLDRLERIASHRVCRHYSQRPVDQALIRLLCACALSAPSKSDLQQRDIVIVSQPDLRRRIAALMTHMPWVGEAPGFLIFCANGCRLLQIAELRNKPFPNAHLDLFFNAVGDAAIALATCLCAAAEVGLGCCPISEIRNHAAMISEWLDLPKRVIPFAGLCLGWPATTGQITPRLPLSLTLHENQYEHGNFEQQIEGYDQIRVDRRSYSSQRATDRWGIAARYGWSEDKARQYAEPQRADFGKFVRAMGFSLD